MGESVHAPRGWDQDSVICLIRPSKKGVDDGERVNESMSQNAGPEISIRRHVCRSQDQKRQFRNKLFQPHVYNNGRNQTKQTRAQSQASKLLLISFHGRLSSLGLKERKYSAITRKAIGFSCSAEKRCSRGGDVSKKSCKVVAAEVNALAYSNARDEDRCQ